MEKRSLKREALITAASGAAMRALGFVMRMWISRILGAEALGVMELASGAHMLALTPAAAGLPGAVSRLTARAETEAERRRVLAAGRQMAVGLGAAVTPLFLILAPFISRWLGDDRTLPSLLLFAPCVLLVGVSSVYDGYFFGRGRALPPAVSEGAEQAVRLLATGALAGMAGRMTAAYRAALPAFATVLGEAAGLMAILAMAGRTPTPRQAGPLKALRKQLFSLALPLMLNRLCHTGLRTLCSVILPPRLMAGGLSHAEALSRLGMLNGMVMPMMLLPGLFSGAVALVCGPAMARCRNRFAERRLGGRMILASLAAGSLGAGAVYLLAPWLANRVYRLAELTPLFRAAWPMAVLLPAQQAVGGILTGLGLQRKTLTASLLGGAATLLCTWQWAARSGNGIFGALYASLTGHALTLLCMLISLALRNKPKKESASQRKKESRPEDSQSRP